MALFTCEQLKRVTPVIFSVHCASFTFLPHIKGSRMKYLTALIIVGY